MEVPRELRPTARDTVRTKAIGSVDVPGFTDPTRSGAATLSPCRGFRCSTAMPVAFNAPAWTRTRACGFLCWRRALLVCPRGRFARLQISDSVKKQFPAVFLEVDGRPDCHKRTRGTTQVWNCFLTELESVERLQHVRGRGGGLVSTGAGTEAERRKERAARASLLCVVCVAIGPWAGSIGAPGTPAVDPTAFVRAPFHRRVAPEVPLTTLVLKRKELIYRVLM